MNVLEVLMVAEIIISALIIGVIVLQPKEGDASAGTLFGGGFAEEVKRTKRGFELFLHNFTIFLAVAFVAVALAIMFLGTNA